jgi:hypothetical protein
MRFYVDPNSLTMGTDDEFHLARWIDNTGWNYVCLMTLGYDGADYYFKLHVCDDDGYHSNQTATAIPDEPHYIEMYAVRASSAAAGDGSVSWWVNGVEQTSIASLDNWDLFATQDIINVGAIDQLDIGTSGAIYVDEIAVNDTGAEIGAVPSFPAVSDIAGSLDLSYVAGTTLGEPGISGGRAVYLNGENTHIPLGSSSFATLWDGDYGSAVVSMRVDQASRWTDSSTYRWVWHIRSSSDSTYYVTMGKTDVNHQIMWRRRSGGVITSVVHTFSPSGPTDWFRMGITWNLDEPEIRAFLNGAYINQDGTGFTAWGTNAPDSAGLTVLFAGSSTLQEWIGWGSHCAYWDRVLSDAEMEQATSL